MTAVAVIIFAGAVAVTVTSLAQEAPPSVEGPRYGTCVAQHPNDFRGVCAELRRAFKAETMARHGYVDETIADPVAYCRSQMAVKGDPELEALVRNNYSAMYSQCLAYAVRKNSDPENASEPKDERRQRGVHGSGRGKCLRRQYADAE